MNPATLSVFVVAAKWVNGAGHHCGECSEDRMALVSGKLANGHSGFQWDFHELVDNKMDSGFTAQQAVRRRFQYGGSLIVPREYRCW